MNQSTEVASSGRVVVVNWCAKPTANDVALVLRELNRVHQAHHAKAFYLATVPADAKNLGDEERAALTQLAGLAQSCCESIHVVIRGKGILRTLQRSIVTGIMLVTGRRSYIRVHESLDEALEAIDGVCRIDRQEVLMLARRTLYPEAV